MPAFTDADSVSGLYCGKNCSEDGTLSAPKMNCRVLLMVTFALRSSLVITLSPVETFCVWLPRLDHSLDTRSTSSFISPTWAILTSLGMLASLVSKATDRVCHSNHS